MVTMTIQGTYVPSTSSWVRDQVAKIEADGTTSAVSVLGRPVVMMTMFGVSGNVRKVPVMRVEHDGVYAAVASRGGAPEHPAWYRNLLANPVIDLQDTDRTWTARAREIDGAEREQWWARCVEAFPQYAEYQEKIDRVIPVLLLEPTDPE